ncbi:prepilin-type N-terminal cleavage/methylation domain-containing protein [Leptothermofonsia sichuanensis E412]|uniref:prepilin-type N-terminal cleavage/methylation domain-containing protein n=1 Tax=Leptothermofonsia sichuanensis TaxID=2917832 RepID=UPI001CA7B430|nr:prepilin-type N-terminal cleavage/methylation domain-containing protein [Leptothermofonsia sichuanensis]QZZ22688.1 prepilin-type N-terminal cleavage/methylation domain-containing protein [Leptothermofonsia sichuanensis E412]
MVRHRSLQQLKQWLRSRRSQRSAGFTLLELLVSLVIGGIITASLLSLVVDLTGVNQRDAARSETQRDMQLAMNYITQDLREAVFVYDGECLAGAGNINSAADFATSCPGLINYIPASMSTPPSTPVLAFWRVDRLPETLLTQCRDAAQNSPNPNVANNPLNQLISSGVPCVSGKSYTLVVYAFVNNTAGGIWQGKGRIVRYQLAQFNAAGTRNNSWVDPLQDPGASFRQWPFRLINGVPTAPPAPYVRPGDTPDTLVDFVDNRVPFTTSAQADAACPTPSRITPLSTTAPFPSFYACVRGNTRAALVANQSGELGVNQEVLLVLQGNAAGKAGIPVTATGDSAVSSRLAPLQTRVLTRGIVDKAPK